MEPNISVPYSPQPVTWPFPEQDESSPRPPIRFLAVSHLNFVFTPRFIFCDATAQLGLKLSCFWGFYIDHTQLDTVTVGRSSLDEWSARRTGRDLQISTLSAGFKPAVPAVERPQTYALDRTAAGVGDSSLSQERKFLIHPVKSLLLCTDLLSFGG